MGPNTDRGTIPSDIADAVADADDLTLRAIVELTQAELPKRRRDRLEIEPGPARNSWR